MVILFTKTSKTFGNPFLVKEYTGDGLRVDILYLSLQSTCGKKRFYAWNLLKSLKLVLRFVKTGFKISENRSENSLKIMWKPLKLVLKYVGFFVVVKTSLNPLKMLWRVVTTGFKNCENRSETRLKIMWKPVKICMSGKTITENPDPDA